MQHASTESCMFQKCSACEIPTSACLGDVAQNVWNSTKKGNILEKKNTLNKNIIKIYKTQSHF